jgi:hypothetical protein
MEKLIVMLQDEGYSYEQATTIAEVTAEYLKVRRCRRINRWLDIGFVTTTILWVIHFINVYRHM